MARRTKKSVSHFIMALALSAVSLLIPCRVRAENPPRIGRIIIIGNTATPDYIIRGTAALLPGQILTPPELRRAEIALGRLKLFVVNPGCRPRVTVIGDPESEFKDILIQVQEKPGSRLPFVCREVLEGIHGADWRRIARGFNFVLNYPGR